MDSFLPLPCHPTSGNDEARILDEFYNLHFVINDRNCKIILCNYLAAYQGTRRRRDSFEILESIQWHKIIYFQFTFWREHQQSPLEYNNLYEIQKSFTFNVEQHIFYFL